MINRETKEKIENSHYLEVDFQQKVNRSIFECKSTFYVGVEKNIHNAINRYLPSDITNLICEYYNLNDCNIEIVKQLANSTDPNNSIVIGARARLALHFCISYFCRGIETKKDKAERIKWIRLVSMANHSPSRLWALGLCSFFGIDSGIDYRNAVNYFRQAVNCGDVLSEFNLGFCYEYGIGVVIDKKKAARCYQKAAEQGVVLAQLKLGDCYKYGCGVVKDTDKSFELYILTAKQGVISAEYNVGIHHVRGRSVKDMQDALRLYRLAASRGYANAQYKLGICYEHAQGVVENMQIAVKWYLRAANQGHSESQYSLGNCYKGGLGVSKDYIEAAKWYRIAAEKGHGNAQTALRWLNVDEKETKKKLSFKF